MEDDLWKLVPYGWESTCSLMYIYAACIIISPVSSTRTEVVAGVAILVIVHPALPSHNWIRNN